MRRHLQLPQHPKVFSTILLHHPVTDVISDPCSGLSTSSKWGATAPISPWDHYKHARHEKDKEEEEDNKEDEEVDEDMLEGELDEDPTKSDTVGNILQ